MSTQFKSLFEVKFNNSESLYIIGDSIDDALKRAKAYIERSKDKIATATDWVSPPKEVVFVEKIFNKVIPG